MMIKCFSQYLGRIIVCLGLFVLVLLFIAQPAYAHPGHGSHLITEQILTPQLTTAGFTLAFGFGAVHALTPGHGKTIALFCHFPR